MKINRLKNRISFYRAINGTGNDGRPFVKNELVKTIWCEVSKNTIKEFKKSTVAKGEGLDKKTSEKTFVIREKQSFTIDHTMILIFNNEKFEIVDTQPDDQNAEFMLIKGSRVD